MSGAAAVVPVRGRLFRAKAAAAYLGISVSRVRTLIRTGELVALRTPRGRLEGVYEADCDAWIAARRGSPAPARTVAVDERIRAFLPDVRRFG